jgi:hypothetical protein
MAEFVAGACDADLLDRLEDALEAGLEARPARPSAAVTAPVVPDRRARKPKRPRVPPARPPRVTVLTLARDEAAMLPRWVDYYGKQVGVDNLIVLDDNSSDGSTDDLPCPVLRLPPGPWKKSFGKTRMRLVSGLGQALLGCYDVAIFCDADEFIVPDPAHHDGLLDYLMKREDWDVMAPVALNVLHKADIEPPLDPSRRILEQRHFVKFAPVMCKPSVKRIPAAWTRASHGIAAPFQVDPELFMIHLKFHDEDALRAVGDHRQQMHGLDGRSSRTTWEVGGSDLVDHLRKWVTVPSGEGIPELDVRGLDLEGVVKPWGRRRYRAAGKGQLASMATHPLLRLPDRFSSVL